MLNNIKSYLNSKISQDSPVRLLYHKLRSILAAIYFRFPGNHLHVIAVTGTKGKTTSCNLIAAVLEEAGYNVAMATSINFQIGDNKWVNNSKITTQNPFKLQSFLRLAVDNGCKYCVLEVSSHAIAQSRIWGINIDMACLTHIDKDHIEYHGDLESYISAKEKLFKMINGLRRKPNISKVIVLNQDDEYFERFNEHDADLKMTYGLNKGTVFPKDIRHEMQSSIFTLTIPNNQIEVKLNLPGMFNIANALLAAAVGIASGINLTTIKTALEEIKPIPGRLEKINVGQPYQVIVDYAHTVDSLTKLCSVYKPMTKGRLILVFGCTGGGRDKAKRPLMGEVADKYADIVILTNDDPYFEDEVEIIDQIAKGIKRKEGENLWKIVSRMESIHLALMLAKTDDTVIIAGKGCEEIQVIRGDNIPWDDRKIVHEFLSRTVHVDLDTPELLQKEFLEGNPCLEG